MRAQSLGRTQRSRHAAALGSLDRGAQTVGFAFSPQCAAGGSSRMLVTSVRTVVIDAMRVNVPGAAAKTAEASFLAGLCASIRRSLTSSTISPVGVDDDAIVRR